MTLTTTPTYPTVGESTTFSESSQVGEVLIVELLTAPDASTQTLGYQLIATDETPSTIFEIAAGDYQATAFTFDASGEYTMKLYDLRRWDGSPQFDGDSGGDEYFELLAVYDRTALISSKIELNLYSAGGEGVTLQLTVNHNTIRASELLNPTTEKAKVAALESTVLTPLAALVTSSVTGMNPGLMDAIADLHAKYESHRVEVGGGPVHLAADATNVLRLTPADSLEGAIINLNEIREELLEHMKDGSAATVPWHTEDDLKNLPIAAQATSLGEATVLLSDLRLRGYARHQVQTANPTAHGAAGGFALATAAGLLDDLIVAYFDAIVVEDTKVNGEPEGAIDALHQFGFTKGE